jgi:hypothetical protein
LTGYDAAPSSSFPAPEISPSLARADALEREIIDLCAQINAAGYRLLQPAPLRRRADRRKRYPLQPTRWQGYRGKSATTGHRQHRGIDGETRT